MRPGGIWEVNNFHVWVRCRWWTRLFYFLGVTGRFFEKKMVFTFLCGMIDFGAIKSFFSHFWLISENSERRFVISVKFWPRMCKLDFFLTRKIKIGEFRCFECFKHCFSSNFRNSRVLRGLCKDEFRVLLFWKVNFRGVLKLRTWNSFFWILNAFIHFFIDQKSILKFLSFNFRAFCPKISLKALILGDFFNFLNFWYTS